MKHIALTFALVVAGASAAGAQARVATGRVFDDTTGCPLTGVSIHVVGGPAQAITNSQGRYRLTGLPSTDFTLEAARIGYQAKRTLSMTPTDSSVRADFSLIRATGDSARPQMYPKQKCHLEPTGAGGP
ncbi:MAG: carboxypeptidase regulatory-like domain-containing protein [Gemmatimonadales bacterium]